MLLGFPVISSKYGLLFLNIKRAEITWLRLIQPKVATLAAYHR
nr:MAG TPA: hypothetical protein [Caudoviricetes sp.]